MSNMQTTSQSRVDTTPTTSRSVSATGDYRPRQRSTETRPSFRTSEFIAFVVVNILILIAAYTDSDSFARDDAWMLVAGVTAAYLISRGLAKAGSREPYFVDHDGDRTNR